jgi:dephospho-CoA kinase
MLKVGLTGGIASGKTTVANFFKDLGAEVIDTDKVCHRLMAPGKSAYHEIISHFGPSCLNRDKTLNRDYLRERILYSSPDKQILEKILHPKVLSHIKEHLEQMQSQEIVIVDVPLLFEVGWQKYFDYSIVVYAEREICLNRLSETKLSKKEAVQFFRLQMSLKEKVKKADFIIDNSGELENTKKQVEKLWRRLKSGKVQPQVI